MKVNVFYIADIISKSGLYAVKTGLPILKAQKKIDFVVGGANSVTHGLGLGFNHAIYLSKLGVNCLTLGEFAFHQKDLVEKFSRLNHVVRPANYPSCVPGCGWQVYKIGGNTFAVVVLLGQAGYARVHLDNPFYAFDRCVRLVKDKGIKLIFVDFWACTTAEKKALFHYAKGRVTAVWGSHSRVLSADADIKEGTASITCAGRTGSIESVGGMEPSTEIYRYKMSMYPRGLVAWEKLELQGVLVECDSLTGLANGIQTLRIPVQRDAMAEIQ